MHPAIPTVCQLPGRWRWPLGHRGEEPAGDWSQTLGDGLGVGGSQAGGRVPGAGGASPARQPWSPR